jgi:anti-sigma28 factor (negative regulator of flagellin synthesis)
MDGANSLPGIDPAVIYSQVKGAKAPASASVSCAGCDALSSAGSGVAPIIAYEGVRMEKVAALKAALAAGTYHAPASAVAAKVVDAMLLAGQSSMLSIVDEEPEAELLELARD